MRIVLDTNVLVSGLLNPFGAPGEIVRLVASGEIQLCYEARILSEYHRVLARPKFGFDSSDVMALLDWIAANGCLVPAGILTIDLPHKEDAMFYAACVHGKAEYLVTGNLRHFPKENEHGVKIIAPGEFLNLLAIEG